MELIIGHVYVTRTGNQVRPAAQAPDGRWCMDWRVSDDQPWICPVRHSFGWSPTGQLRDDHADLWTPIRDLTPEIDLDPWLQSLGIAVPAGSVP